MGRLHKAHEVAEASGSTDALILRTSALAENLRDTVETSLEAVNTSQLLLTQTRSKHVRPDASRSDELISSTKREMHELGNLIVSMQACLRQLGGRQRTDELEGMVRAALESCEKSVAAFRNVHKTLRVDYYRLHVLRDDPSALTHRR